MKQIVRFFWLIFPAAFCGLAAVAEEPAETPRDAADAAYPAIERFIKAMELARKRHPDVEKVTYDRLVNYALEGMMAGLDPFSSFIHPEMAEELRSLKDEDGGIDSLGMMVTIRENGPYIAAVDPHGAAAEAGLIPGTNLLEIDELEAAKMEFAALLAALRKPAGVVTKLKVKSRVFPATQEIPLVHRAVPTRSLGEAKMLDGGDGYLRLEMFGRTCASEVEAALDELEEKGMKRLIFDLRGNPGGELGETVKILGLLLPSGTEVVSTRGREEQPTQILKTPARQRRKRAYPVVVLTDRMSASASELTAGALQDLKRAKIVGETSFGKGSVQQIMPMSGGTALRLTIAKYHTPSGNTPHGKGIKPDIEVKFSDEDRARFAEKCRIDSLTPEQRAAVEKWNDPGLDAARKVAE
ncbi:MAG: S41 family peptidase [Verrucomicrobiota bacterium]